MQFPAKVQTFRTLIFELTADYLKDLIEKIITIEKIAYKSLTRILLLRRNSEDILLYLTWQMNPEFWDLESGMQLKEYRIQVALIKNLRSSTWNPKSIAWNPESKTVLDSPNWGETTVLK